MTEPPVYSFDSDGPGRVAWVKIQPDKGRHTVLEDGVITIPPRLEFISAQQRFLREKMSSVMVTGGIAGEKRRRLVVSGVVSQMLGKQYKALIEKEEARVHEKLISHGYEMLSPDTREIVEGARRNFNVRDVRELAEKMTEQGIGFKADQVADVLAQAANASAAAMGAEDTRNLNRAGRRKGGVR